VLRRKRGGTRRRRRHLFALLLIIHLVSVRLGDIEASSSSKESSWATNQRMESPHGVSIMDMTGNKDPDAGEKEDKRR